MDDRPGANLNRVLLLSYYAKGHVPQLMNDLSPQKDIPRLPAKAPTADLHDRLALKAQTSEIESLRAELLAHIERTEDAIPPCLGHVVNTECVLAALMPHWRRSGIDPTLASTRALIFHLPPEFEPCLSHFAERLPQVFNHPDTSLRCNTTYQGWAVRLPSEPHPIEVWVTEFALDDAIGSAFIYPDREWGWVPVIALAGDSVAVCGFEVDEVLICCAQAASMNARDTRAEDVYSNEELDAAALKSSEVGLTPWFQGRWETENWDGGSSRLVWGATVYNREDAD
jgi:hypothetical protein